LASARWSRRLSRLEEGRPIEARLAAAGLPALPRTAWLEIDLAALVDNLATIRGLVGAGVGVEPVVKADAYGHGALPVTRALEAAGADGFSVATWDEALELRLGGVRAPVLVLYAIPGGAVAEAARRRVAVSGGDVTLLEQLVEAVARQRLVRSLAVHLQVETGLGRDGLLPEGVAAAARRLRATRGIRLAGLWTHLQEPEDAARTAAQLERFEAAARALRAAGIPVPIRHVAASGDLLHSPVSGFEVVRPGLLLYGLDLDEAPRDASGRLLAGPRQEVPVRPALSIHARPVRVVDLPAGWGISYGPTFVTARSSRIATLPLGYADGWPRDLSNQAEALVRGRRVPIVGSVAMDALMVDVTDVPGPPVTVADEFVLLGRQGDAAIGSGELARARTTISREVVTALSRRLPRVYHAATGATGPVATRTLLQEASANR
jgi:alanine racemase